MNKNRQSTVVMSLLN